MYRYLRTLAVHYSISILISVLFLKGGSGGSVGTGTDGTGTFDGVAK